MPVLNGVQAAKELKELMSDVPIILFTLFGDQIDIRDVRVDRVVSKNDAADLMPHVRSLIHSGLTTSFAPRANPTFLF
jgi:DNA-binding NarL/FixJ family response regulator